MTREERIKIKADRYVNNVSNFMVWQHCDGSTEDDINLIKKAFIEGAEWADETMIKKVEKWLENFLEKTIQKPSINDGYTSDTIDLVEVQRRRLIEEVLYDFKKAMEE